MRFQRSHHIDKADGLVLVWKFKMVTQSSTSHSSNTLMWRISLQSYNMMHAIADESSHLWSSLKDQKVHTKVNVELIQDFDVENISIKLHDTGNLWSVIVFTSSFTLRKFQSAKRLDIKVDTEFIRDLMWRKFLHSYNMMHAILKSYPVHKGSLSLS